MREIYEPPKSRRNLRAFFLYLLAVTLLYGPVVFDGKSLLAPLYQPHGILPEGAVDSSRPHANTFNVDLATPAYYEAPINRVVGDLYRAGRLPLWNPYQASGHPLAAQYSTRAFFPYQIIEDLSPVWTWDFFMLGRPLVAGFFTYLFLRALGLGFASSFAGGLFYMFSGTFVWFINLEQFLNTAMMLPVVMWAVEGLAGGEKGFLGRRTSLAALSFALLILAGQPETALYVSLLALVYFVARTLGLKKPFFSRFFIFAFSYALGLAVASPLIFLFLELVGESHHIHPPGGAMGLQYLVNWKSIFAALTPGATELPTNPDMVRGLCPLVELDGYYYRFLPINGVWDSLGGFTGGVVPFLILTGLLAMITEKGRGLRSVFYFFVFFGLSVVLKNLGVRPFIWLGALPLFDQVWSLRWAGPVWTFSFAVSGAAALECLVRGSGKENAGRENNAEGGLLNLKKIFKDAASYIEKRPLTAPFSAFLILSGLFIFIPFQTTLILSLDSARYFNELMAPYVIPSMLYSSIVTIVVLVSGLLMVLYILKKGCGIYGLLALALLEFWWSVPRGYDYQWIAYKWIPFSSGLGAAFLLLTDRRLMASVFAVFSFLSFMYMDHHSPMGLPERRDPFRQAPFVRFLKERAGPYRVTGAYGALFPNFSGTVGLMDIRYVNAVTLSTYHEYRTRGLHADYIEEEATSSLWFTGRPERCAVDAQGKIFRYSHHTRPAEEDFLSNLRAYSLLGVKFFILPRDRELRFGAGNAPLSLVYDREVKIYENTFVYDRAFVVYDFEFAESYQNAQNRVFEPDFDPRSRAVVEARPADFFYLDFSSSADKGYEARIKEYGPDRVVIDVATTSDGLLVLTDLYYPGWKVTVRGKRERLFRVNGLFRGVIVKKGRSEVVFFYRPRSFLAGAFVSLLGITACTVLFLQSGVLSVKKDQQT